MVKYGLKADYIQSIQNVLSAFTEVDKAILYGSRAKGNFKPASDIDLTLTGDNIDLSLLYKIDDRLDDLLLPYTFDLSVFSRISNPDLVEHINRVGQVFYEKNK